MYYGNWDVVKGSNNCNNLKGIGQGGDSLT